MRILHAIKCGPHKILARGTERYTLQWLTESCCGPVVCRQFARFIPCGTTSPDPACTTPPGKDSLYVCRDTPCVSDGLPWYWSLTPHEPNPRVAVIRWMGRCWLYVGLLPPGELPPAGADVIDLGQTVECVGRSCNDSPCGDPIGYAEAIPCDPTYNGPRPLYCPAGLPFECSTFNPAQLGLGNYPACFTFKRNAPTQPYPPNTPVVFFPPSGNWQDGRTCCQCRCTGGPPLAHAYCPGTTPGGYCCPDPTAWATSPVIGTGLYRIDFDPVPLGYPAGFTVRSELIYTLEGTAGAPIITIAYRLTTGTDVQEGFNYDHAPMQPIFCPLTILELSPGAGFFPTAPGIFDSCVESRTFNKWQGSWTGRNPTGDPGSFNVLSFTWLVRVINPEPPGCSNDPCRGTLPLAALAQGSDNGGIGIRGTGSRTLRNANDALVQQWMQQHYGGCAGCGDSPNPV